MKTKRLLTLSIIMLFFFGTNLYPPLLLNFVQVSQEIKPHNKTEKQYDDQIIEDSFYKPIRTGFLTEISDQEITEISLSKLDKLTIVVNFQPVLVYETDILGWDLKLLVDYEGIDPDKIKKIHYSVNESPMGLIYITYIFEWYGQRPLAGLGHNFDYEPIIIVLDNSDLIEVLFDKGHYTIGRNENPYLKITNWSHRYKPIELNSNYINNIQYPQPESFRLQENLFTELNNSSLEIMNNNLKDVATFWGLYPPMDLTVAVNEPWKVQDNFTTDMPIEEWSLWKAFLGFLRGLPINITDFVKKAFQLESIIIAVGIAIASLTIALVLRRRFSKEPNKE